EILWNDLEAAEPVSEVRREGWSHSYVQWSPFGTYLATLHQLGVAIYGGPKWDRLRRFSHPGVDLIDFSPNEKYLVTASAKMQDPDDPKDPQVWRADIRSKIPPVHHRVGHKDRCQVARVLGGWVALARFQVEPGRQVLVENERRYHLHLRDSL